MFFLNGMGKTGSIRNPYLNVKPVSFVTGSVRIAKGDINKREKHTNSQSAKTSVNQNGIVLHSPFFI